MPQHEGRSACCHAPTEWIAVDALLSLACLSIARVPRSFPVCLTGCMIPARVVPLIMHPAHPSERRVGRIARMTMPFGHVWLVADGCCYRVFHRPSCPCSARLVVSVVTPFGRLTHTGEMSFFLSHVHATLTPLATPTFSDTPSERPEGGKECSDYHALWIC